MTKLTCPHCSNQVLEHFFYLEDLTRSRSVLALSAGVLRLCGEYTDGDEFNARAVCLLCQTEFPIPGDLKLDFSEGEI
jgi:hypothetical protein